MTEKERPEKVECPYCFDGTKVSYVSQENEYTCKKCKNWFKPKQLIKTELETFHITPCHEGEFKGVECLEGETQYGFYKDDNDIRPSSCTWLAKEDVIKLWGLFDEKK